MTEIKRYEYDRDGGMCADPAGEYVEYEDFDRVTAERDAERRRADVAVADANDAEAAGKKVSELLANRTAERDAALGREAALQKCISTLELIVNSGANQRDALQQRLTAADERADMLEGLLREVVELDPLGAFLGWQLDAKIDSALKPAEGGGDA